MKVCFHLKFDVRQVPASEKGGDDLELDLEQSSALEEVFTN